jgi:hypothetical protein
LLSASGCGGGDDCDFEAETRAAGGAGVMDCGLAREDDTEIVDRCAVSARAGDRTFRALYEQPDGSLQALIHAAGGGYLVLRTPAQGGLIERADCESSAVVQRDGRSLVECTGMGPFEAICE